MNLKYHSINLKITRLILSKCLVRDPISNVYHYHFHYHNSTAWARQVGRKGLAWVAWMSMSMRMCMRMEWETDTFMDQNRMQTIKQNGFR